MRREEPGANTEGAEEMINCQTGETCRDETRDERYDWSDERLTTKHECIDQAPDTL